MATTGEVPADGDPVWVQLRGVVLGDVCVVDGNGNGPEPSLKVKLACGPWVWVATDRVVGRAPLRPA